jgi:DNA-binding CsgD family transcriptional regulator
MLLAYRGQFYYLQGRFEKAVAAYRNAIEQIRPTGSGAILWFLGPLGLVLAESGQRDTAIDCFSELETLATPLAEWANARLCAFAYLAVGYSRLGMVKHAVACYPALLPFQGQFAPIAVDRALGLAALAGGHHTKAERHLADAEAAARRIGLRPELALTLLQRGLLRQELGTPAQASSPTANDVLAEGLHLCEVLGMQRLGRRLLTASTVQTRQRRQRGAGPKLGVAALSERELEVLRLLAEGKTNREIAETLTLSEKTVARHLTHIFNKITVENRAGAVAFALRHGLA